MACSLTAPVGSLLRGGGGGRIRIWHLITAIVLIVLVHLFVYSRLEAQLMTRLDLSKKQLFEQYVQVKRRPKSAGLSAIQQLDVKDVYHEYVAIGQSYVDFGPERSPSLSSPSNGNNNVDDQFNDQMDTVVVYNRLPKTGSTTLMGLAYDLCEINRYHVLHVNISRNNHIMSLSDQARFAHNATTWTEIQPALFHGHFAYVDFAKFATKTKPIYINLLRKPLDRLVSYYYFLRYGDDYRPHVVRRKTGDKMTFDECVEKDEIDCAPENMWLQIPFFCGHSAQCWVPGNAWALETAKHNLVHNYMLVGVTEELQDFVVILEATLPRFFKGATKLYLSGKKSHLRRTTTKFDPMPQTVTKIETSTIWKMENEFYQFVLEQFHFVRKRTIITAPASILSNGRPDGSISVDSVQKFAYEKIRPK